MKEKGQQDCAPDSRLCCLGGWGVIVELEDAGGKAGPRSGAVAGRDSGRW